jgi:hypothetical protein
MAWLMLKLNQIKTQIETQIEISVEIRVQIQIENTGEKNVEIWNP